MKLIDKDAIVAELRHRLQESLDAGGAVSAFYLSERMKEDDYILSFIDTLEVKEVDLEKEIKDTCRGYRINESHEQELGKRDIENIAHYFYKLGLNTRKEA